jgi:glutaredoxin-like protein NrdH
MAQMLESFDTKTDTKDGRVILPKNWRNTMSITIYSLPNCVQCDMTKKLFTREGVEFETIDLSTDSQAAEFVRELGYQAAPVVTVDDRHWSGFKVDKIMTAVGQYHALKAKDVSHVG